MRSMTGKLTLAMVLVGLISMLFVVVITQIVVNNQAKDTAAEQAFERLQSNVDAFANVHGSWQRGIGIERFDQYYKRRLVNAGVSATNAYVLVDDSGVLVLGSEVYPVGSMLPSELMEQGRVLTSNGKNVATAVQVGPGTLEPGLSSLLESVYRGLKYGLGITLVMLLISVFWIGRFLTEPLRQLTNRQIKGKDSKQYEKFELESQDEVELLTEIFKHLRGNLNQAQDDLRRSRGTINEQAKQLSEIRIRDETTQLYNQRYFNERGGELFARSQRHHHPLCCVIVDIDRFTQINDKFSHKAGDKVLQEIANLLRTSTRESDVLGRYSGGKFVIAFSETPLEQAKILCNRLSQSVEVFNWNDIHPELSVTIRIGLCADMGLDNFEQMVAVADTKLYLARDHRNSPKTEEAPA